MVFDLNLALGLSAEPDPDDFVDDCGRKKKENENITSDDVVQIEEVLGDTDDDDVDALITDNVERDTLGGDMEDEAPIDKAEEAEEIETEEAELNDVYRAVNDQDQSVKIESDEAELNDVHRAVKIEKNEELEKSLHDELVRRGIKKDEACDDGNPSRDEEADVSLEMKRICELLEEKFSVGSEFSDLEKIYLLYCEYARMKGFSVRKSDQRYFGKSGEVRWKMFHCSCSGFPNYTSVKHRLALYRKLVTRSNCKARIIVGREDLGPFVVLFFDNEHNHDLVRPDQTYLLRSSRNFDYAKKSVLNALNSVGIGVSTACKFMEKESGGVQNVGFIRKYAYHHIELNKKATRVEDGDAWSLVDYFTTKSNTEPFFWWKYQLDDAGRILNIFWRDTRCAVDYDAFGDVLSVDTTFRTNKYNLVAVPFVGINHHTSNVMFGMALMSDETTSSFLWLFETFLESMHGKEPKIIFTDQCRAMMNAIDLMFPNSKHRLCQWHIGRNCNSNFGKLNGDSSFRSLWYKCMKLVETEEDFDNTWSQMMSYEIENRSWYTSMHKLRHRWASVFTRGIFSAGVLATSRSESTNSALKKLVRADIPMIEFVRQYEEVQTAWRLKESNEDTFAIWNPGQILQDNELLQHAASVYTRTIYKSFEYQLTESFNYVLDEVHCDLGDGNIKFICRDKAFGIVERTIVFNTMTHSAICSCGMWETEGIICPHIIKVFDRRNVKVIPENLILRRWTKKAKKDLPILNYVLLGDESSVMQYMTFANTTMRHLYEMVSSGMKHAPAREKIAERMKSLGVEIAEIMASCVGPGSGGDMKKEYRTPGGKKFRDPQKMAARGFANVRKVPNPKPPKRTPKTRPNRIPAKKLKKCSQNINSEKDNADPKVEPDPLNKYFPDDDLCFTLSLI